METVLARLYAFRMNYTDFFINKVLCSESQGSQSARRIGTWKDCFE